MGKKRLCYVHEWSHLLAENGNDWVLCWVLTTVFTIVLFLCQMRIIYAALMALVKNLQVYRTYATHTCTIPKHHIFTLPPLKVEEEEVRTVTNFSTLIVLIFTIHGISICIWQKHKLKSFLMWVLSHFITQFANGY